MTSSILVNDCVTDTMALVLRLEGRKLGAVAQQAFAQAEAGKASVFIPAMVFAELLYLAEKKRIGVTLTDVVAYLGRYPACKEYPLTLAVVEAANQITDVPELHDRLIAGTACQLKLALVTNDPVLRASTWVQTVW